MEQLLGWNCRMWIVEGPRELITEILIDWSLITHYHININYNVFTAINVKGYASNYIKKN